MGGVGQGPNRVLPHPLLPFPPSLPPLPSSPISQKAGGRRATTAATDLRPILRTLFHRRAGCSLRVLQPCDLPHGAPLLPPPH